MTRIDRDRVVFSILYNESREFLQILVENFLGFTGPESILVLNMPVGREISCQAIERSDRVFVFNGAVKRHKFGHTLLNGHVETFDHALRVIGDFDYFCPLASNSLLVRPFDLAATKARRQTHHHSASVDVTDPPGHWWWPKFRQTPALGEFIQQTWNIRLLCQNQIEGLFATRSDWGLVHASRAEIAELGRLMDPRARFALEEILPSTLITNFGSSFFTYVCRILGSRGHEQPVRIDDLLGLLDDEPAQFCAVKWFERSPHDLAAVAVAQPWSRELLAGLRHSIAAGDALDLLTQRTILEAVVASLRRHEVPHATQDAEAPFPALAFGQQLTASRQLLALDERRTASGDAAAYLVMEDTGHALRLDVRIGSAGERRISINAERVLAPDAAPDEPVLEGYLYLTPTAGLHGRIVRLTVPLPPDADQEQAVRHVIVRSGPHHKQLPPWHVSDANGMRSYYFQPVAVAEHDPVWLGLPVFSRWRFDAALDLI